MKKNQLWILIVVVLAGIIAIWYFTKPKTNPNPVTQGGTAQYAPGTQVCDVDDTGQFVTCKDVNCKGTKNDCYLYRKRKPVDPVPPGYDSSWHAIPKGKVPRNDNDWVYKCDCEKQHKDPN